MKKALLYFTSSKARKMLPSLVFIYDDGNVKIVGNENTIGGSLMASSMRNRFAAMSPSEKEKEAKMMFEEMTPAAPGYAAQYMAVDYTGDDKKMVDEMFDKISSRNFDIAKKKQNG